MRMRMRMTNLARSGQLPTEHKRLRTFETTQRGLQETCVSTVHHLCCLTGGFGGLLVVVVLLLGLRVVVRAEGLGKLTLDLGFGLLLQHT